MLPVVVFTRAAVKCKTVAVIRFYLKECGARCSLNAVVAQQSCLSKSHVGGPVYYVHCFAVFDFLCQDSCQTQYYGLT